MAVSSVSQQLLNFLFSLIFGVIIGVYYDIFRLMRHLGLSGKASVIAQDIFFMVSIAPFTYIFCIGFNGGAIRAYILIGELMGALAYRYTLGRVSIPFIMLLITPIRFIWGLIMKPLRAAYKKAFGFIGKLRKIHTEKAVERKKKKLIAKKEKKKKHNEKLKNKKLKKYKKTLEKPQRLVV